MRSHLYAFYYFRQPPEGFLDIFNITQGLGDTLEQTALPLLDFDQILDTPRQIGRAHV